MNLDNLKPAWQRFRLLHSMQPMHRDEIFVMLEKAEGLAISQSHGSLVSTILFIVLVICCQGG